METSCGSVGLTELKDLMESMKGSMESMESVMDLMESLVVDLVGTGVVAISDDEGQ